MTNANSITTIENNQTMSSTDLLKLINQARKDFGEKPVALLEYLIKTYTQENETVLDFTCGSGSTLVAAKNTNRHAIGIELDETYFKIAQERIR